MEDNKSNSSFSSSTGKTSKQKDHGLIKIDKLILERIQELERFLHGDKLKVYEVKELLYLYSVLKM